MYTLVKQKNFLLEREGWSVRPEASLGYPWKYKLQPSHGSQGIFLTIEPVLCRLSPFLFLPFEEVKQDQKSQQEPVGMGSKEPAVSTVIG